VSGKDVWIGLAQVVPVDPAGGDIGGGFVHVLAPATGENELRSAAAAMLRELGLRIADLGEAEPVRDRLHAGSISPEIMELAIDTALAGTAHMSELYSYPLEEDEDDDSPANLQGLAESRTLVNVRGWGEYHEMTGYVAGVGAHWALIQIVDGHGSADGFRALKLGSVAEIEPVEADSSLLPRVLAARPLAGGPPTIELDDVRGLLQAAQGASALIHLVSQDMEPGAFWIGRIAGMDDDGVLLQKVSPLGTWLDEEHFRFDAITRVGFGGRYEDALAAAVGALRRSR
jgi:hypothetical protein